MNFERLCLTHRVNRVLLALGAALFAGLGAAAARYTDLRSVEPIHGNAAEGAKKASVCFACHGADGASVAPTFPRLAGQRIDYLYERLLAFKHASPKDPYYSTSPMTAMAQPLSDLDMRDLSAFFASQQPRAATITVPPPAAVLELGKRLFEAGDPGRGIPPCQGCHGPGARGSLESRGPYAVYPILRAQSATYIAARLANLKKGLPRDSTSAFIMGNVARSLDDDDVQSVAAWVSSLPLP